MGDYYYFGNSSVVAFLPEQFGFIFEAFNRAINENVGPEPKHLATDERFICYAARGRLRVHSRHLAVKFHWEFMAPFAFVETIRGRLPWVACRRRNLVAVAFEGENLKLWRIAARKIGDVVTHRRLKARWAYPEFVDCWREEDQQLALAADDSGRYGQ